MTLPSKQAKTQKRATRRMPSTPKPRPSAFAGEAPCEHCGCEWFAHTVDLETGDFGERCANSYCGIIQQLRAMLLAVSKLAAETPQFDNPLDIERAKRIRDAVLGGKLKITVSNEARS